MLMHHVVRTLASDHDVTVVAQRIDDGPTDRRAETFSEPPEFEEFMDGNARVVQLRISRADRARMLPLAAQVIPGPARFAYGRMRVPLSQIYARAMQRALAPHVRGTDVVHSWSADLLAAAGLRAARSQASPFVITPFVHPGQWGDDPASARVYRHSDAVIGLLDAERPVFERMGVEPSRVAVFGGCTPGVSPAGNDVRRTHDVVGPLVVFMGARRPYKGFDLLLAASDRVRDVHPGVTFAFVGPGDPLDVTATRARVIDVGEADDQTRDGWLAAADIMCLPSAHEIFPISVLEAYSARTAVLLSDIPPLREIVRRSGGGDLTERTPEAIAAALNRMLASPSELQAAGDAGYEFWREGYTPEAIAERHERLYRTLTAAPHGALGSEVLV
jgi:phosphatidylinositol alpha-1,6-mannosyltransferase